MSKTLSLLLLIVAFAASGCAHALKAPVEANSPKTRRLLRRRRSSRKRSPRG